MDVTQDSHLHFLDLIYQAAEHPERWRRVYEELVARLGVMSIHVLGLDKRHGTLSYSDGANMPVQGELAYMQHYRFIDPRTPVYMAKAVGEWSHCHEYVSEEVVAAHPFYQEFLLPHDRRYMSGCKLVDTPDASVLFSTHSSRAQGPLSADAIAFLDGLMPHLRRACRIGIRNFVYSTQALVGHMLVNKLRQPVVLMSPTGEVMHVNEAAGGLMQSTGLVAVQDGKLRLPPSALEELLRQCEQAEQEIKAHQVHEGSNGVPQTAGFRSLRIEGPRGSGALYAFYCLLSPQGTMGTFGLRPVVMLLFYHPQTAPAIDGSLLYAVFGLTPAECRIATLLAEGLSLKQIAQAHGTQPETVRKQLRSIYQKTSTNRQPELIRLLLHLPHNAVHSV